MFSPNLQSLSFSQIESFFLTFKGDSPFKKAIPFSSHAAAIKIFSSVAGIPSISNLCFQTEIFFFSSLSAISKGFSFVGSNFNLDTTFQETGIHQHQYVALCTILTVGDFQVFSYVLVFFS